ncbi:MAG: hypothetical protein DWQ05_18960 [Calditrichaeota bacterium]|nr:MAG: hypothetical protein DWQ05_18960 [Calditrichota bacterium]
MQKRHPHEIYKEPRSRWVKYLVIGFLLIMANSGYLFTFNEVSTFYFLNVLFHIFLGLAIIIPFTRYTFKYLQQDVQFGKSFGRLMGNLGFATIMLGFLFGLILLFRGKMSREIWIFYSHIGFSVFGCLAIISSVRRAGYQISVDNVYTNAGRWGLVIFVIAGMLPVLGLGVRWVFPTLNHYIHNNDLAKNLMYGLTDAQVYNHFFASPASTSSADVIDTDFINDSESCGQSGCHTGIYSQWKKSTHWQSALENKWYRSSIQTLQQRGQQSTVNFCSGCHAPGLLLSNESIIPVDSLSEHYIASARIGCNACHAVKRVNNTLGNGDFVLQRPRSYAHMSSTVKTVRDLFAFKVHVDPEPHKNFFLKPFMTRQNSEFCSSCHKLNSAVRQTNDLAIGGMDNYDSWQKGPFAGDRVDSFFSVREHDCADCHMPRLKMADPAAKDGTVHDHSFNYHVREIARKDSNSVVIDRYTISPIKIDVVAIRSGDENSDLHNLAFFEDDAVNIKRGNTIQMDVLVQSNEVGHDFPGRFSESIDTWLQVVVEDNLGRTVFKSGAMDDFNRIDPQAHFWGTFYEDDNGKRIEWPHGFSAGKMRFDHRIAPLTSELVSFKFQIPENCGPELVVATRLKQRHRRSQSEPLFTMKGADGTTGLNSASAHNTEQKTVSEKLIRLSLAEQKRKSFDNNGLAEDKFQIWSNYGIALFLQKQWPEAERAFLQAAKLNSDSVDIWINLLRAGLMKGDVSTANIYLKRARELAPTSEKLDYYQALLLEKTGDLTAAHSILRNIRKSFYSDRVFLLKFAEVQVERKFYNKAGKWYRKILEFAPDDIEAHRGLRAVYKELGKEEEFLNEDKLVKALEKALLHNQPTLH